MGNFFSSQTEEAIRLIWMQFDKQKIQEGQKLLIQATEEGDADACCFLARTYMGAEYVWEDAGLEEDINKAKALVVKSIHKGSACGVITAIRFDLLQPEVIQAMPFPSLKAAFDVVLQKAEAGHPYCQYIIGNCCYWQDCFSVREIALMEVTETEEELDTAMLKKAVYWYEKALYGGMSYALTQLEGIYLGHTSLPENEEQYKKALQFAAELGAPMWQKKLGEMYFSEEAYGDALIWFEKAAENGVSEVWRQVGYQYQKGLGIQPNQEKAAKAFEIGAKAGDAYCQVLYGKCCLFGKGVSVNQAKAFFWIAKGAAGDNSQIAKLLYGHCLLYGLGIESEPRKAIELLLDVMEFVSASTYHKHLLEEEDRCLLYLDLGDAFEKGIGIEQHDAIAGYYFACLAGEGHEEGRKRLSRYRKSATGRWKRKK